MELKPEETKEVEKLAEILRESVYQSRQSNYLAEIIVKAGYRNYAFSQPSEMKLIEEELGEPDIFDQIYEKQRKEAYDYSEKYHSDLSSNNFNPNRPADRSRWFCVTGRKAIQKATAQTQLASNQQVEARLKARIKELEEELKNEKSESNS